MYALHESLAFLLNRAGAAVANAFSQELKQCGLSLTTWRVLASLWSSGDQSLTGLADVTSIEVSTLSRQVASLVERGLIVRRQSGVNWRSITISLAPEGRAIVERLIPSVERHERAALDGIGSGDVRRLKHLLTTVYENIITLDEARQITP